MCVHVYSQRRTSGTAARISLFRFFRAVLTEVLDGVVSLLAVHADRLSVGAAHPVANDVAPDQDVGGERWRPGHDDAVGQRPDVQRARLVGHLTFCGNANEENIREEAAERSLFTLSPLNANNVSSNRCGYLEQLDLQTTLAVY